MTTVPGWETGFSRDDIDQCLRDRGLLSMELELSRACNLRCQYCYASSGEALDNELSHEAILDAVDQAVALGARKIVVLGGGEPLVYPRLLEVLEHIDARGARTELFTNATLLTQGWANDLARLGAKVVFKLNSLRPEVQDRLGGVPGTFERIQQGLSYLLQAGYPSASLPLGAQTVICRDNLRELPEMWAWLRERDMIPYFEMITLQGRAKEHPELEVSLPEHQALFEELSRLDAERFGNHWEPHPSVAAFCCDRHEYSCTVTTTGEIQPCPGVDRSAGNIKDRPLAEILRGSRMFNDLRNIRTTIKGECAACDLKAKCYGCRGMAYQATGDYLASDPLCWRCQCVLEAV